VHGVEHFDSVPTVVGRAIERIGAFALAHGCPLARVETDRSVFLSVNVALFFAQSGNERRKKMKQYSAPLEPGQRVTTTDPVCDPV